MSTGHTERRLAACLLAAGLLASAAGAQYDQYGGCLALAGSNTSGFFRPEKIGDRWWLMTPDNHAFFSLGVDCILYYDGWGGYVEALDTRPSPYGIRAKYNNDRNAWNAASIARLARWGCNTWACWSDNVAGQVRVRIVDVTGPSITAGCTAVNSRFADVFDPIFESKANQRFAAMASLADDPTILGVFSDNEIYWQGAARWDHDYDTHRSLIEQFIALDGTIPGKGAWVAHLQGIYPTIGDLNAAYQMAFTSWDGPEETSVLNTAELPKGDEHPAIEADKVSFMGVVAERYYSVCENAMRAHDANHLYMGDRFALWTMAMVDHPMHRQYWAASGRHCDVVSVNRYGWPESEPAKSFFNILYQETGKAIIIGEWNRWADDSINVHPWPGCETQMVRAAEAVQMLDQYFDFTEPISEHHPFVGTGWFAWYDQPTLGRPDGEAYQIGVINAEDEEYLPFTDLIASHHAQVYDYLIDGTPIELPQAPPAGDPQGTVSTATPEFDWGDMPAAAGYTLMYSPVRSFPSEQTIRVSDITESSYTPEVPLCQGEWFWTVRAVDAEGHGGHYSPTRGFVVALDTATPDVGAGLACELPSAWAMTGASTAGPGFSMAFRDEETKTEGQAGLRIAFTVHSLNKTTGEMNDGTAEVALAWAGGDLDFGGMENLTFDLYPHRTADTAGVVRSAARHLRVRVADRDGATLDQPVDPTDTLAADAWHTVSIPLGDIDRRNITGVELYINCGDDGLLWDLRISYNIDNVRWNRPVQNLSASPSGDDVLLEWTNPDQAGFARTEIWAGTSGYPSAPGDGELICSRPAAPGSSDSAFHEDRLPETTYWYSAFAFTDNGWARPAEATYPDPPASWSPEMPAGWNLISLPLEPADPDPAAALDDVIAAGNALENNLYGFEAVDAVTGRPVYTIYPSTLLELGPGAGYWLLLDFPAREIVQGTYHSGEVAVDLLHPWTLVGHPHSSPVALSDCRVRWGGQEYAWADARSAGLVDGTVYTYFGAGYSTVRTEGADDDNFRPWCAYWVLSYEWGLQLVIPAPWETSSCTSL